MKSTLVLGWLSLAAVVAAQSATLAPNPQGAASASIRGRVIAADSGQPLKGAILRLSGAGRQDTVVADPQGRYEFASIPGGRYTLNAYQTGYLGLSYGQRRVSDPSGALQLRDGERLERVDFVLPRASVIVVRVTDDLGQPVSGVSVRPERYAWEEGVRRLSILQDYRQTNDQGVVRLYDLRPGDYLIPASPSFGDLSGLPKGTRFVKTYYPGTLSSADARAVTVDAGQEIQLNVALISARFPAVSGVARNVDGTPFAGPGVRLQPVDGGQALNSVFRADGTFSFGSVRPGAYMLEGGTPPGMVAVVDGSTVNSTGRAFISTPVTVGNADLTGLGVVSTRGGIVRGTIVFDSGGPGPLQPSVFQLRSRPQRLATSGPDMEAGTAAIDKDWSFTISGIQGARLFRVTNLNWLLKSVEYEGRDITDTALNVLPNAEIENVRITLTQRRTEVRGRAVDARKDPVSRYAAIVFAEDPERWTPGTRFVRAGHSDQNGQYVVQGLPPGRYLAAAVDDLENGEEADAALLATLALRAARLTLGEGESRTLELTVQERR